jgi:hypothetical protein
MVQILIEKAFPLGLAEKRKSPEKGFYAERQLSIVVFLILR